MAAGCPGGGASVQDRFRHGLKVPTRPATGQPVATEELTLDQAQASAAIEVTEAPTQTIPTVDAVWHEIGERQARASMHSATQAAGCSQFAEMGNQRPVPAAMRQSGSCRPGCDRRRRRRGYGARPNDASRGAPFRGIS